MSPSLRSAKLSEVQHCEVEHLKTKVWRKTALKFLSEKKRQLSASNNMNTSPSFAPPKNRNEKADGVAFAALERGGFPLLEMLKITKTIFLTQLQKNRCISETKTSKVGPF